MTGNETPGQMLEQARRLDPAATKYLRASRRKAASRGNVDWAWWLSFQQKITCVERFLFEGRCGRQQRLRIRMPRIEEQIDQLGLLALVNRRQRLVKDQQLRIEDQGSRDRHALALACRERMRQFIVKVSGQPDLAHGGDHTRLHGAARDFAANAQALFDHSANCRSWR